MDAPVIDSVSALSYTHFGLEKQPFRLLPTGAPSTVRVIA